jgi:hypothetical protein
MDKQKYEYCLNSSHWDDRSANALHESLKICLVEAIARATASLSPQPHGANWP